MKNQTTKDPRAMNTNGMLSHSRMIVIEALEAQQQEGATIDELVELIGADLNTDHPKMSIGQSLSKMENDGYVVCNRNRWYLKEHFAEPIIPASNGNGSRAQIAPMVQKRSGKTISLYTTPEVYDDAIAIAMLSEQHWYKLPFFVSMRICIGQEAPMWTPEQEQYTNIEVLKITHKNGKVTEKRPSPSDIITIAMAE